MGFIFAALFAGYRPNTMPIIKQKPTAIRTTVPFMLNDMLRLETTMPATCRTA